MTGTTPKIRITFEVREMDVLTYGLAATIQDIRLTGDGKVIVPLDLGGGLRMGNPAPSGTWERVAD